MSHTQHPATLQASANPYATPPAATTQISTPTPVPSVINFDYETFKILKQAQAVKSANMTLAVIGLTIALMLTASIPGVPANAFAVFFLISPVLLLPFGLFLISYFRMACQLNGFAFGLVVACVSFVFPIAPPILYLFHYYQLRKITTAAGIKYGLLGPTRESVKKLETTKALELDYGFPAEIDGRFVPSKSYDPDCQFAGVVLASRVDV